METSFLVISIFLLLQRLCLCSNSIMVTSSSSSNVTCIERERQSLLAFKQSLVYGFNRLSTWSGLECCEWKGVGCDAQNGHVVKLDLPGTPVPLDDSSFYYECVGGKLSPSLQNLKHLRYVDLSMNNFSGNIPEFLASFQRLEYLNLSNSGFDRVAPHHLANLSRLQYLDLSNIFYGVKFLEASIDDLGWVSSLSSLRHLDLSGITIRKHIDWFQPISMLPSLLTLNLAFCDVDLPTIKLVNSTSLISLDLSHNEINSTIPVWLSNLTGLMHLNLHDNHFHGKIPHFLGVFSNLSSIDMSFNSFDTSMPDSLFNLSSLLNLDLSFNMFSGPIPTSLGLLSRLERLHLSYNQLSGNIPTSLGHLSNLKNLDLSGNSLTGVLSETHFTKLTNLKHLRMSSNSLALNFSSQWIPPFQLQLLDAGSCNVGPHFPNWLQTQKTLYELDLFNSSIRDTIPNWFENIQSHILYLDFSHNQIGGKLPRFHGNSSNKIQDRILKMNSNKFVGTLATFPSNVRLLDLSDNLLSGHLPRTDRTMSLSLELINLSKNHFTGSFPVHLCKVTSIYVLDLSKNMFYGKLPGCLGNLTDLHVLDLSQNKFYGRLPRCLGNLTSLLAIDLANNTITGIVPCSLGSLRNLNSLHLQNNRFEGEIPVSLQNLTDLVTMDLGNNLFTGNVPLWIGEELSNIRILNLQSNKFKGKIPLQLCQLTALRYLNLARNNISGIIPQCFGNLTGMTISPFREHSIQNYEENIFAYMKGRQLLYTKTQKFLTSLDLSSNNIVGEIPDALMNLVQLRNLNLSRNLLQGEIPMIIGNLKQLESIDLSMNKLSGRIPQSLTTLNFLSYLNLSFNHLHGAIPVGNQIQTLDDTSIYERNSGLCGPPVLRSCNENDVSYNHVNENEGKDDTEGLWFYAGMGPGFVVGLLGLLGSLHFIRSWRVAYFEMLENVYDWLMVSILLVLARVRRKVFE